MAGATPVGEYTLLLCSNILSYGGVERLPTTIVAISLWLIRREFGYIVHIAVVDTRKDCTSEVGDGFLVITVEPYPPLHGTTPFWNICCSREFFIIIRR
jgi:hypothetical protein